MLYAMTHPGVAVVGYTSTEAFTAVWEPRGWVLSDTPSDIPSFEGSTASGPPSTGFHGVGDFVTAGDGEVWICTVAGTPGTWVQAGAGSYTASSRCSRVLTKLRNGDNIKVTYIGDSIFEGTTATSPGTDDAASVICTTLASRFGVTVTKSNRADSGDTAAEGLFSGRFASALTDDADLYVISFGHNDIKSDLDTPGIGYPLAASMGAHEHMVARLRLESPNADVMLVSENPYTVASTTSNAALDAFNEKLRQVADDYGVQFVDGNAPFRAMGDWDSAMADSGHPNSAGHALLAAAVLAKLPTTGDATVQPVPPVTSRYGRHRYDRRGWSSITTASTTALTDRFKVSGTWSGTAPYTSSTAASLIECQFVGTEAMLCLDCGAGNGVVDIIVDGVLLHDNFDLSGEASGQRRIPLTGLNMGHHVVQIVVVSGTVNWRGFNVLQSPAEFININSARVTLGGVSWTEDAVADLYGGRRAYANIGGTITFDFVGTGLAVNALRPTSARLVTPTIDGVAGSNIDVGSVATQYYGSVLVASGLEYGRHSVVLTIASAANTTFGGVAVFDETRLQRPRKQAGIAEVGETIVYPCPFAGRPMVRCNAITTDTGVVRPTTPTATGFTLSGTASEQAVWEAEGSTLIAY